MQLSLPTQDQSTLSSKHPWYKRYFFDHLFEDTDERLTKDLQENLFRRNVTTPNNEIIDREENRLTSICARFGVKFEGIMGYDWKKLSKMTKGLRGMTYNHLPVLLPDIYNEQHSPKNVEEWFPFPHLLCDDIDVFISSMTSIRFVKNRPTWVSRYGLFNARIKGQTVHKPWEQDAVRTGFWMLPREVLTLGYGADGDAMNKALRIFGQVQFAQGHDGTFHMPIHGIYRENPHYPHLRAWSDYLYDVPAEIQYPSGDEIPNYEMTATRVQRMAFQRALEQNPELENVLLNYFQNFIISVENICGKISSREDADDFLVFMLSFYKTSLFHVVDPNSKNPHLKSILAKYPFLLKNNKLTQAIHTKDTIQTTDGEVQVSAVIDKYRERFESYAQSVGIEF